MKKILVVLLILSVAAGVFAQEGSWSLGGKAEIGTAIDFESIPDPTVKGMVYNNIDWWDGINGTLELFYHQNGLRAGLVFNTFYGIDGVLDFNGENYKFVAENNFVSNFLNGNSFSGLNKLWGHYKLLNGMIHLEAAYKSRDFGDGQWRSNTTALDIRKIGWATYAHRDGNNFLMADINIADMSFGIILPDLFTPEAGQEPHQNFRTFGNPFLTTVFDNFVFGMKFNLSPIEFAAQFMLKETSIYVGGSAAVGPTNIGLSFAGKFENEVIASVGADVGFGSGPVGAGVSIKYYMDQGENITELRFGPRFEYQAIPSHLLFKVGSEFGLPSKNDVAEPITWKLVPELFWNFKGTGAGGYWGFGTGMIARYVMSGGGLNNANANNVLYVGFKWNFF